MAKTLGERLRDERTKRGWTLAEVANRLGVKGLSTYSNWEYDRREPDVEMLSKLASLYEVSIDYLLNGRSEPESKQDFDSLLPPDLSEEDRAIILKYLTDPNLNLAFKEFAKAPEEHIMDLLKIHRALHGDNGEGEKS